VTHKEIGVYLIIFAILDTLSFFLEDISMVIFQTLEQHLCTRVSVKIVIWILVLVVCLEVKTVYRVGFVRLGLDIMLCMSKNATIY